MDRPMNRIKEVLEEKGIKQIWLAEKRIKKVFEEKVSNKPSWQKNWKKFLYCQFLCLQQKTT